MTDAAQQMFRDADRIQHRPLTDAQWADSVESYQRLKLYRESHADLVKAHCKQTGKSAKQINYAIGKRADGKEAEARDELQGTLELLGGGNESE